MSSNISSLKKMKKQPLPNNMPFRHATAASTDITVEDKELLEEVTEQMAAARIKDHQYSSRSSQSLPQKLPNKQMKSDSKHAPSDYELMTLMTSRITNLEKRIHLQNQELADKDKKIRILDDKLKIFQKSRVEGSSEKLVDLEKKCLLLQEQLYEMEAFLADYGMIWVGDRSNPNSNVYFDDDEGETEEGTKQVGFLDAKSPGVWKPSESLAAGDFSVNYDQFVRNVSELNMLAGEGIAKIHHTPDGARLRLPDPIPLTLFSNGLVMFSGPFRPFTDVQTQELVQDIMDGYFPSELQARFPEGVPFQFTDKHYVTFKDKRSEVFKGEGQVLGGENIRSRLVPSATKESRSNHSLSSDAIESEIPGPKLTMEQFLNKIPNSVIKNGKVISIRKSIKDTMTGNSEQKGSGDVTVIDTPQLQEIKERLEISENSRPPSSKQVTTLRIKSELGDHTFILKMRFSDKIGDIRKYLDKERGPAAAIGYKIVSAFPKTIFDDDAATLEQCGLTPNATLHLVTK